MRQPAFIISPIGKEGHEDRDHADWVRREIIQKACDRLRQDGIDINPQRADEFDKPGRITDDVLDHIVEDRVVFVVLGGNRPNCYFELGIAIAAGRPVVVLQHDKENFQFDTHDYRTLQYELRLGSPAPEEFIDKVVEAVRKVLGQPHHDPRVHRKYNPLGREFTEYKLFSEFREISPQEYSDFFEEATNYIGLQGMTLQYFSDRSYKEWGPAGAGKTHFLGLLKHKILNDGCNVDVVFMHKRNRALAHLHRRIDANEHNEDLQETQDKIDFSYKAWTRFKTHEIDPAEPQRRGGTKGSLRIIQLEHGIVRYRLSITDKAMILSPYLGYLSHNARGPAVRVASNTNFYREMRREFEDQIAQNEILRGEHAATVTAAKPVRKRNKAR